MPEEKSRLTQYTHGGGCGCKIAPAVLEAIIRPDTVQPSGNLIVGYSTKDDAAVYDMGDEKALISTTDFFTPIVDDALDFGKIASANAISDVYAMGGRPLLALAVLGWPVEKLPAALAREVLEGARAVCREAGIPLAGGHSIDNPEPVFGLAVTGITEIKNLKKNSTARAGNRLFLTKPLGVGMVTTAQKRGNVPEKDLREALAVMMKLNSVGFEFGQLDYVTAMTDVTGFGFLGHLAGMCEASNLSAEIRYSKVPLLSNMSHYVSNMIYPDSTFRNWNSVEPKVKGITGDSVLTLCDPQTNGGLLVAVEEAHEKDFTRSAADHGYTLECIGRMTEKRDRSVYLT